MRNLRWKVIHPLIQFLKVELELVKVLEMKYFNMSKEISSTWSKVTATFPAVTTSTGASHGNGLTLHSTFHSQIKGNNNSHIKFRPLCKEAL